MSVRVPSNPIRLLLMPEYILLNRKIKYFINMSRCIHGQPRWSGSSFLIITSSWCIISSALHGASVSSETYFLPMGKDLFLSSKRCKYLSVYIDVSCVILSFCIRSLFHQDAFVQLFIWMLRLISLKRCISSSSCIWSSWWMWFFINFIIGDF